MVLIPGCTLLAWTLGTLLIAAISDFPPDLILYKINRIGYAPRERRDRQLRIGRLPEFNYLPVKETHRRIHVINHLRPHKSLFKILKNRRVVACLFSCMFIYNAVIVEHLNTHTLFYPGNLKLYLRMFGERHLIAHHGIAAGKHRLGGIR